MSGRTVTLDEDELGVLEHLVKNHPQREAASELPGPVVSSASTRAGEESNANRSVSAMSFAPPPPPSVPSALKEMLAHPTPHRRSEAAARLTLGGPAPLQPQVRPLELLSRSKAFDEIMSHEHVVPHTGIGLGPSVGAEQHSATKGSPAQAVAPAVPTTKRAVPGASAVGASTLLSAPCGASAVNSGDWSVERTAMSLYGKNLEYAERVAQLESEVEHTRLENEQLKAKLEHAYHFVPPREFLPRQFYEQHREIIEALSDYHRLYREEFLPARARKSPAAIV